MKRLEAKKCYQYYINREKAELSALSLDNIDKYDFISR